MNKKPSEAKVKNIMRKTYNQELHKNKIVLKQANLLPPSERKIFLKKLGKKFLEGAVAATGAAVAVGIVYGLSRKKIHSEVDTLTGKATNRIIKDIPHVTDSLKNELGASIDPLVDRAVDKLLDRSDEIIKKGTESASREIKRQLPGLADSAKNEVNRNLPNIINKVKDEVKGVLPEVTDTAANNIVDSLQKKIETEETQDFIQTEVNKAARGAGGLANLLFPKRQANPAKEAKPANPANKNKNLQKQVDQKNSIPSPNGGRTSRSQTPKHIRPNYKESSSGSDSEDDFKRGIQEVEFGKRKGNLNLKNLKFDLKKLSKIK
jgi:hypothetical protein